MDYVRNRVRAILGAHLPLGGDRPAMAEGVNDAVVSPATTGREAASRVRPVVALVRELFETAGRALAAARGVTTFADCVVRTEERAAQARLHPLGF